MTATVRTGSTYLTSSLTTFCNNLIQ